MEVIQLTTYSTFDKDPVCRFKWNERSKSRSLIIYWWILNIYLGFSDSQFIDTNLYCEGEERLVELCLE